MHVGVTGASGLIGTKLTQALQDAGHQVTRFVRRPATPTEIPWSPGAPLDPSAISHLDAIVHLAGANVGDRRWTRRRKATLIDSRRDGTRTIAAAMAAAKGPKILLSTSAVGYYGNGTEPVNESSPNGDDFLAHLCHEWESAAQPARDAGIRVVHPRMGVVLAGEGGALRKMLLPFKLGLGGPMGTGRQCLPWISMPDAVGALVHLLDADVEGPVNVVAPTPVTQREFAKALGKAMHRPAFAWLPGFVVSLMFGEMGRTMLLGGQNVDCQRLVDSGFSHGDPDLGPALVAALASR